MPFGYAVRKRFYAFFAASARIVIFCRLRAGRHRSNIFFGYYLFIERMRKFAPFVRYGIGCIATVAFGGFCSVLRTGGVAVGNVIRKAMPERVAVFKRFCAFFAACAGIVVRCFFGASGGSSKILCVRFLLIKGVSVGRCATGNPDCGGNHKSKT